MSRELDMIAAGHICLDITPDLPDTGKRQIEEILQPGTLVKTGACAISTGGPVSNTGLAAKKLGCRVAFMARVGDDFYGRLIRDLMNEYGSTEGIHIAEGVPSSYTIVIAPAGIDRIFLHCPSTNDQFTSADVDFDLVKKSRLFHLGYPPLMKALFENEGEELATIFHKAKDIGVTTSLDMAFPDPTSEAGRAPWQQILRRVLPSVDLFLPSLLEILYMLNPEDYLALTEGNPGVDLIDVLEPERYEALAAELLELGTKIVVIKAGHRGTYLRTGDIGPALTMGAAAPREPVPWSRRELWCSAFRPEKIASATGSGDACIAGFLTAFLRGLSPEDCLRVANCVGSQNLRALDSVSGVGTWEETQQMLSDGNLEPIDPGLDSSNWTSRQPNGVYSGPLDRK